MTTLQLTKALDELTPEFLTDALRSSGVLRQGTVAAVAATPVGQGVGLLCQLARLELQYTGAQPDAPRTVVAKLPTTVPETRAMVAAFGFYERETQFYQVLAPEVALRTPAVYYAAYDTGSGDFALLLEDLSGLRIGDQTGGCSAADAELVVRELAALHAQWWNSPGLAALSWMPATEDPRNAAGLAMYPLAWPIFLQRFGAALPAEIVTAGERLGARATEILARFSRGPRTLCHGDPRLDNMFFAERPDDPPFTMIDWQIAVKGVGTYDIGYFLTQSIDPALRREKEMDWLQLYHGLLLEGGVAGYSFDQCLEDYRWTAMFCFAYPVMGGGLGDVANDRALALGRAMTERSITAILDWKAHELLA